MNRFDNSFHIFRMSLLAAVTVAAGCAVSEKAVKENGGKALTGVELREFFAGAGTMQWSNVRNNSGTMVFSQPDKIDVNWGTGSAKGTFRFTEDGYCSQYPTLREGKEICYRVYRTGKAELSVFTKDGRLDGRIFHVN
mgnify:FL=1